MESNWVDFKAIKQAVSIEQILQHYGVKLKRSGKELRGRCPIHKGEGMDSFHANMEKNAFQCFSCQDRGEPNKPLGFRLQGIDHCHPYLSQRGVDPETAEYFGVGFFSGKGSMSGRVVIPIENERGDLVAYAGRSVDGSEPKYRLPAGFKKSQVLYNLARAVEETDGTVVLVEGFFDCIKVTQAEHACVALMGCSMSEEQQAQLGVHFRRMIIMLDGDEAGRRATTEIASRLAQGLWVRIVSLSGGKQPDQLSTGELRALVETI